MNVTLLGPQRFRLSARTAIRNLEVDGPVAAINAGWQEREADDGELGDVLDGRMVNLQLFRRWEDVLAADAEYAEASRHHNQVLDDQQSLYTLRLRHAVDAAYEIWRRDDSIPLVGEALSNAIEEIRTIDRWHLDTVDRVEADFESTYHPHERLRVVEHRAEVAEMLGSAVALAITGGHVGVILKCLQLFVGPLPPTIPVVAWSAGAMALGEQIVLFNDNAVDGSRHAEVYRRGVGLFRHVVPLPHARRRLHLHDSVRVAGFARRFGGDCCLVLDDGAVVKLTEDGRCPPGAPVLTDEGVVATWEAA